MRLSEDEKYFLSVRIESSNSTEEKMNNNKHINIERVVFQRTQIELVFSLWSF